MWIGRWSGRCIAEWRQRGQMELGSYRRSLAFIRGRIFLRSPGYGRLICEIDTTANDCDPSRSPQDCRADIPPGSSRRHSLPRHAFTDPRFEATLCHHVHRAAEQCLQLELQPAQVEQSSAGIEVKQEVQVALIVPFAARYRTKDANTAGAVLAGDPRDVRSLVPERCLKCRGPRLRGRRL
jgi:hypothetical protein